MLKHEIGFLSHRNKYSLKKVKVLPLQNPPKKEKNFGQHLKKKQSEAESLRYVSVRQNNNTDKNTVTGLYGVLHKVFSNELSQQEVKLRNKNSLTGEW